MSTRLLLYDGIHIPQCENSYEILSGRQKFVERFHLHVYGNSTVKVGAGSMSLLKPGRIQAL